MTQSRRRKRDELAKAIDAASLRFQLYNNGAELAKGDEATYTALQRHLLRNTGQQIADLLLRSHEVSSSAKAFRTISITLQTPIWTYMHPSCKAVPLKEECLANVLGIPLLEMLPQRIFHQSESDYPFREDAQTCIHTNCFIYQVCNTAGEQTKRWERI